MTDMEPNIESNDSKDPETRLIRALPALAKTREFRTDLERCFGPTLREVLARVKAGENLEESENAQLLLCGMELMRDHGEVVEEVGHSMGSGCVTTLAGVYGTFVTEFDDKGPFNDHATASSYLVDMYEAARAEEGEEDEAEDGQDDDEESLHETH